MEKSSDALRTISEVSELLNTPKHVLRFWENKFTQLQPMKRGGGRRYYRPEDIVLLRAIRNLLYSEGFTIRGVQQLFKRDGIEHVKSFADEENAPQTETGKRPALPAGKRAAKHKARTKVSPPGRAELNTLLNTLLQEIESCRALLARNGIA